MVKNRRVIMRNFLRFFLIFLCLCSFSLQAQTTSKAELAEFAKKVNAGRQIKFIFTLFDSGNKVSTTIGGEAKIYKNKYFIALDNDCKLYSDGVTSWLYNPDSDEVMITSNNSSAKNILENPFSILSQDNPNYKVKFIRRLATSYPQEIICIGEQKLSIKILSFSELRNISDSVFIFKTDKYPGLTINDLR